MSISLKAPAAKACQKARRLPIVDAFRTLVNCPPPAMLVVFQSLVLVVVPWV
jgi:hypothetical protein